MHPFPFSASLIKEINRGVDGGEDGRGRNDGNNEEAPGFEVDERVQSKSHFIKRSKLNVFCTRSVMFSTEYLCFRVIGNASLIIFFLLLLP